MRASSTFTRFAVILAALAVAVPAWSLTDQQTSKISKAIPKKATAKPQKPRRVLMFSQTLGYRHGSIPYAQKAFELMGEATGAYELDSTEDPQDLTLENLQKYDALLLNNPTGEWLTTPSMRQGLLKFVSEGKGLAGIHAATDGNFEWPEFGRLIGGFFQNHPWRASDTVTLKINEPDHPVTQAFAGQSLEINDEIYQIRDPYSRESVLELVSLDTEKTDMNKEGITRTDGDFPVSWVHTYGKGRVFYTSLGHNEHIYSNPVVLQHYLDGLQFALGDLDAPSKSSGGAAVAAAVPAAAAAKKATEDAQGSGSKEDIKSTGTAAAKPVSEEDFNAAVAELDAYDFGDSRNFLLTIDEAIRASDGNDARRREMVQAFLEKANDKNLTYAARDLAMRRLAEVGHDTAAEKLQPILQADDDKLAESALRAIASISGETAEEVLVNSLGKTKGSIRIGIANALGQRRAQSKAAVDALTKLARGGDNGVVIAAVTALGKIGSPEAGTALLEKVRPQDGARDAWLAAMNTAATSLATDHKDLAGQLYDRVLQLGQNNPARLAAYKGRAELEGDPESVALKTLQGDAAEGVEQVARQILVRGNNPEITDQLLKSLDSASPEMKVTFIEILGARGDKAALDEITGIASNATPELPALQLAGIAALKHLGDQKSVPVLLSIAAEQKGQPADSAVESLVEMRVPEVDAELVKAINNAASPKEQVVAIQAAVERKSAEDITPELLKAAASSDNAVASAAFKALSDTAKSDDLEELLKLHDKLRDRRVIQDAGRTISKIARDAKGQAKAGKTIQLAFETADDESTKISLLSIMGRVGGDSALKTLEENAAAEDEKIRESAVRALAEFPDPAALPALMKISTEDNSQVHRVLALRGIARLLSEDGAGDPQQRLEMARKAMELAPGPEEKKAVIGAVAELKTTGVVELLMPFLDDEDLKDETVAAIIKQAPIANQIDPGKTAEQLNPIHNKISNEQWNKLEEVLTPSEEGAGAIRAFQISQVYRKGDKTKPQELITTPFPPEQDDTGWDGIFWAGIDEDGDKMGKGDLLKRFPDTKNAVVYLRAYVWSPEERTVELRSGSDDGLWVLVNGTQEVGHDGTRSFKWDDDKKKIQLNRGWNELFLKVSQGTNDWAVAVRLVDEDGKAMSDLKHSALSQQ